jgi:hypothetical protein
MLLARGFEPASRAPPTRVSARLQSLSPGRRALARTRARTAAVAVWGLSSWRSRARCGSEVPGARRLSRALAGGPVRAGRWPPLRHRPARPPWASSSLASLRLQVQRARLADRVGLSHPWLSGDTTPPNPTRDGTTIEPDRRPRGPGAMSADRSRRERRAMSTSRGSMRERSHIDARPWVPVAGPRSCASRTARRGRQRTLAGGPR